MTSTSIICYGKGAVDSINIHSSIISKTALVVGGTNGIGKYIAKYLVSRNIITIIVGRDKIKTENIMREIGAIGFLICDVSNQADIVRLATDLRANYTHFDYYIMTASIMNGERVLTKDGIESILATNYLWRFQLTNLIRDLLTAAPEGSRVLNVAGSGLNADIFFDDPNFEHNSWTVMKSTGQAHQLNDVLTIEMQRRWGNTGNGINFHTVLPGQVSTRNINEIWNNMRGIIGALFIITHPLKKDPDQSAIELCELLFGPISIKGGKLWTTGMTRFHSLGVKEITPALRVIDPEYSIRCWELSEQLINTKTQK